MTPTDCEQSSCIGDDAVAGCAMTIRAVPPALRIARLLRGRGCSVIPVPRPRPGVLPGHPGDGKVPVIAWKNYQKRLPRDAELVASFGAEPMNIAVVTGAVSKVVVIDADDQTALSWCTRHLPYTPWQTATPRGFHLFYRHPGSRVKNRARLKTPDGTLAIDVRGDGGYVIAPGSVHASGAVYEFAGDWSSDDVPLFSLRWLQGPTRAVRTNERPRSETRSTGDIVARARLYLAAIPRPDIGHGSDIATLSAACRLTRGFDMSAADAEALLWEWAGGRPGWTREWIASKVEHAIRYGTEPIGGLR